MEIRRAGPVSDGPGRGEMEQNEQVNRVAERTVSWEEFAKADPEMAEFGRKLFERNPIAYLATVRKDGGPRVHPICPAIVQGRLYVSIIGTSPKRHDLNRDGRYVLHSLPGPNDAEFNIRGRAVQVEDIETLSTIRAAITGTVITTDKDIFFELKIEQAFSAVYENLGQLNIKAIQRRWEVS